MLIKWNRTNFDLLNAHSVMNSSHVEHYIYFGNSKLPVSQSVPVNLGEHKQVYDEVLYDEVYEAPFRHGLVPVKNRQSMYSTVVLA